MFHTLAALLVGATAASAVPWGPAPNTWGNSQATSAVSSSGAGQIPFSFPLVNGFPTVSQSTLQQIEEAAHGTLPNSGNPTSLNDTSVTVLELIAFNEIFEVAFFTSLIQNITSNVDGFAIDSSILQRAVLNELYAVQAQEQLHFLGANGILSSAGKDQIQPCKYVFPSNSFDSAIRLASTFTDVVLGTLQDALNAFATDGDTELVPLVGSIIGQEGEQNGFYRSLLHLIASSNPFLTRSTGAFAFSALNQNFVVNGSCPNSNIIDVPIFGVLTVDTQNIALADQTLTFSVESDSTDAASWSVVYINGQNLPVVKPLTNVKTSGNTITFNAFFPAATDLMDGLTIAAVTKSAGPFTSADEVAAETLFGPGLIEIN